MNDLLKTEFFALMNENSQEITNEQMFNAYGKFITHVDTVSQVGNDLTSIIRKLNITRAELVFLSTQIQHEQGRLIMFRECLRNNITPFIIDDGHKQFYYRGLREFSSVRGYLTDTCLSAQDTYKEWVKYFYSDLSNEEK